MSATIDDIDFDDVQPGDATPAGQTDPPSWELQHDDGVEDPVQPNNKPATVKQELEVSVWERYLNESGIKDIHNIAFEDEQGIIKKKDWNDLTAEEQLNILRTSQSDPDTDLDESEKQLINQIRESGKSPQDFIKGLTNTEPVTTPQQQYDFNTLEDDVVYAVDLISRFPDMTDEEIDQAVEIAKQNPELYEKQVNILRQNAIAKQQSEAQTREQEAQQRQEQYQNDIIAQVNDFSKIGDMDISMDINDKERLAQFILPQENGVSAYVQAISDPKNIVKAAWFLQNSDKLMSDLQEYIAQQVKQARQAGYEKGVADSRLNPKVVQRSYKTTQAPPIASIYDLN